MVDPPRWHVTCFYCFFRIESGRLPSLRHEIKEWMTSNEIKGLVLVAPEGINGTVSGSSEAISALKAFVRQVTGVEEIHFKDSESHVRPFRRASVDIRSEIVGMKRPDLVPDSPENHHLTPEQWHRMLDSDHPPVVIDTRNRYETLTGKFKGAIDPGLKSFSEWGDYLEQAELPRDETILIYCTGGIRCEKAILEMRTRGFDKVYQLRDGILGYLAEYPEGYFEGDCFVFDDRVALDGHLQPTDRFGICPGCGLTSGDRRECESCGRPYYVCTECAPTWPAACSKVCRDRLAQAAKRSANRR
ncbi:MAG: hypothetical protein P4L46_01070 [Fimbriimonas sp.]|nr:hypothetical protein [Fimbriimonas sp.]